jgi:DNA primase
MMQTDTTALKESVDLRQIVMADLGNPSGKGGSAWVWRCPFHNEQHGAALAVWATGWHCFGACATGGDSITWYEKYHKMTFIEAVRALGGDPDNLPQRQPRPQVARIDPPTEPPAAEWQEKARKTARYAAEILESNEGKRAMDYLINQRGLDPWTINIAQLGYCPGGPGEWRRLGDLLVPCGITIPWISDGDIWAIKVRRAAGDRRYEQVKGGRVSGSLYWADDIEPGKPLLIVEGEFNALTAYQESNGQLSVVSVGTSSTNLNPYWLPLLATVPNIYAIYDCDSAGDKGYGRLAQLSNRVRRVVMPDGIKDLNEFHTISRTAQPGAVGRWLAALQKEQVAV